MSDTPKTRFIACSHSRTRARPSTPVLMHRDLEAARLQAASIDKPVAWAPTQAFSMFGREGDALMIHTDGLCRRVRLWDATARVWRWMSCAVFDPQTKKLDPSTHFERILSAA